MKKQNKGFTLAELLIVVAIIAVLVAVAIPTFNSQLEKSRQATDLSNLRDAYATAKLAEINGETPAVDKSGNAIKPIKLGAPAEALNMSDEAAANYSGIGYAFVYDPDSGILYPYSDKAITAELAIDFTPTVAPTPPDSGTYSYAPFKIATGDDVTTYAYVNGAGATLDAMFANIPTGDVRTPLKARAQEIRIETANLPGGGKGSVEYGVPVTTVNGTYNGTTLRLWGDTAPDWSRVRIIVEFSYDKNTSSWTLKRVQNVANNTTTTAYVTNTGIYTNATDGTTALALTGDNINGVEVGAIRFATLMAPTTATNAVCPQYHPVNWNAYVGATS